MLLALASPAAAQDSVRAYAVGDAVADFRLAGTDGARHGLADHPDARAAVILFTGNQCPCVAAYDRRMVWMTEYLAGRGVPVMAINAHRFDRRWGEGFEDMRVRADTAGYTFPYLIDETQAVARRFGATRTPEAFVLGRDEGGPWRLLYSGAIDDQPDGRRPVRQHYVNETVERFLAGAPILVTRTEPMGCTIEGVSKAAKACPMEALEQSVRERMEER